MKNSERKLSFSSPIGYSFMLTIMIILTLVIFAVLSLATSLRDYGYSRRAAEKTTAYYEANSEANHILKQIDEIFTESQTMEEGLVGVSQLSEVKVLTSEETSEDLSLEGYLRGVSYEVEINSNQNLEVLLGITEGESGKACYKVLKWKEVSSDTWMSETTLPVYGSE